MLASPLFRYAERRPDDALLPWIRNFWLLEVGDAAPETHHVPPDGCTSLVLRLTGPRWPGLLVSGPWRTPLTIAVRPGDRFGGVRLQPGAAPILLGVSGDTLRNRVHPAAPMLGAATTRLERALIGADSIDDLAIRMTRTLWPLVADRESPDEMVTMATQRLVETNGDVSIAELAADFGVSERTLHRHFVAGTGLSPKQFARIRRLLAAAWRMASGTECWSQVAHGVGYADQPHLNRDVTDLTGLTPSALNRRLQATAHDDVVP